MSESFTRLDRRSYIVGCIPFYYGEIMYFMPLPSAVKSIALFISSKLKVLVTSFSSPKFSIILGTDEK